MRLSVPITTGAGIMRDRRKRDHVPRRQTLGHDLLRDLVGFWPIAETAGSRFNVHNLPHLSMNGTVGVGDGVGSLAGVFSGSNNLYTDDTIMQAGDIDFTFATWVFFTSIGTNPRVFSKRANATNSHEYDCYYGFSNNLTFELRTSGGTNFGVSSAANSITSGAWYFVVAWHDSVNDLVGLQLNNGTPATQATSGNAPAVNTSRFYLGELQQVSRPLVGRQNRFGYWKRLLTADERTYLYNSGRGRSYPFL